MKVAKAKESARKEASQEGAPRDLKTWAYVFISQKNPSAPELANLLGVSVPTVFRVVARLRKEGVDVVSTKRGGEARYEIRDERRWEEVKKDPFVAAVGSITISRRGGPGKAEDAMYDED